MTTLKKLSEPIELQELKQLFFTEIMKNNKKNCKLDVTIDIDGQPIFWAKGYVNVGFDDEGNYQVHDISIAEAGFQWPDFECSLDNKYINELEKYVKG